MKAMIVKQSQHVECMPNLPIVIVELFFSLFENIADFLGKIKKYGKVSLRIFDLKTTFLIGLGAKSETNNQEKF